MSKAWAGWALLAGYGVLLWGCGLIHQGLAVAVLGATLMALAAQHCKGDDGD